jgi:hypothetical protein
MYRFRDEPFVERISHDSKCRHSIVASRNSPRRHRVEHDRMPVVALEHSKLLVVVALQIERCRRVVAGEFQADFENECAAASWLFGIGQQQPSFEPVERFDPSRSDDP